MEITYKNGASTIRLVKHVERDSITMIFYRIAKDLLREGDTVQIWYNSPLKPVSTIFYQILILHQMIALQKL